jgi:hypothetical protein
MGLDQQLYAHKHGSDKVYLGEWRKNYALDKWMMNLYKERSGTGTGFFVPVHLTTEDIKRLHNDRCTGSLVNQSVTGSCTLKSDLRIVRQALHHISLGYRVFYRNG